MTRILDTVDELTPDWFTKTLRMSGTLRSDESVREAANQVIGQGELGLVVLSRLTYGGAAYRAPKTVVVKLPASDPSRRRLGAELGIYESEVRFYQEIAPLMEGVIPQMHWGAVEVASGRFTLVLDDLSSTSVVGDMVAGGTLAQARVAIAQLAQLQAPLWDDPSLAERDWLGLGRTEMVLATVAPALGPFVERFGRLVDPAHLKLAHRLVPKAIECVTKSWKPPFVVAHGDYRLDNLMFGRTPDARPISVIDWQAARLAPPLLDAAMYLSSCLEVELRREHEQDLLKTYHDGLLAAGIGGFSFEDCWQSYRVSSLYPFLLAITVAVALPQSDAGDEHWARLFDAAAAIVLDTDAAALLD